MQTEIARKRTCAARRSLSRGLASDLAHCPDQVFNLGTRAARLAAEYGALQHAILEFCAELPADVLARRDVARVVHRIEQASRHAQALAQKFLAAPAPEPLEVERLDADGLVQAAHDSVRRVMGARVFLHTQIARAQPPLLGHRRDLELVLGSLFLLSAAAMPTGGRMHLFVGPDAWSHTRPDEIRGGQYVRLRLVDNGGPWAGGLLGQGQVVEEGMRQTVLALREAVARGGGHLTCAKARERGNTVELLFPAAS